MVCSKNSSGMELRGRGGVSFGSWVGPHPLPLPARPFVRKCCGFREVRSRVGPRAILPHIPSSYRGGGPGGWERGKDWPAATKPREKVPGGRQAVFLLLFQQGRCRP